MKKLNIALMALFVGLTGCATSKPQPKVCTANIPDPAKTEINKTNTVIPKKACHKRKQLWSQFGIK